MRILMTTDTVGGVWTYSLQLAASLGRYGVYVHLATMGAAPSLDQRDEASRLGNLRLHESTFKLEWMSDPWGDVAAAGDWLLALEREVQPDLVHLNGYAHGALRWRAPAVVVGHSCVLSWWEAVRGGKAPAEWERYRSEVARGLRAARVVIAPTAAMLSSLRRHYGPLPGSRVIPNGRDEAAFPPGSKEHFVMALGRLWDEAKNVHALAEVAPELEWPVYLAGESAHPERGAEQLQGVTMLGKLNAHAVARWLASASIYAMPASYEPFGLSALEAGLARCALVVGDIPSLREVWGDDALFVPPGDRAALKRAISELIGNPVLRESMARRARARAVQYSARRQGAAYYDLYTQLAGGARQSPHVAGRLPYVAS